MSGRGNKKRKHIDSERRWNVGVYTRRSFDDLGDNESNTIINQKEIISEHLKNIPNVFIIDYYVDDGYSGTTFDRPSFKEMFNDIVNHRINAIIVKDLSRLGRNYIEVGKYIEEIFPIYDLRIIAINDDIDSYLRPESINSLIVPIKNLINETYAKDISKKVSSSYETMAKSGKFVAGTPPYGYALDTDDKHHLIITDEEAKIVKKVFEMAINGDGRIKICKYLNSSGILCRKELQRRIKHNLPIEPFEIISRYIWSTSTIGRMLTNESYIGNLVQLKTKSKSFKDHQIINKSKDNWIKCESTHKAIITKSDFSKVQKIIKSNTKVRKKKEITFSIYNKKLKCNDCGRAMCKQEDNRGNRRLSNYFCMSYLHLNNSCKSHKIKTSVLETSVLEAIQLQVRLVIELEKSITKLYFKNNQDLLESEFKNNIKIAEIKIENLKQKKRDAYESWKYNNIEKTEFIKLSNEIDSKITRYIDDIELYHSTYQETIKKIRKNDCWIGHYKRNRKIRKVTKEVLDELVSNIYVYQDGSIKIIFKYQDEYLSLLKYLEEGVGEKCQNGELVYI